MNNPSNPGEPLPASIDNATASPETNARMLAHDLGNALEIVMQTSFLLGTLELGDNGKEWHKLLDDGVRKAATINGQLREALRGLL